jgi:hypothetical protein
MLGASGEQFVELLRGKTRRCIAVCEAKTPTDPTDEIAGMITYDSNRYSVARMHDRSIHVRRFLFAREVGRRYPMDTNLRKPRTVVTLVRRRPSFRRRRHAGAAGSFRCRHQRGNEKP